jgi:hypothetical protein
LTINTQKSGCVGDFRRRKRDGAITGAHAVYDRGFEWGKPCFPQAS